MKLLSHTARDLVATRRRAVLPPAMSRPLKRSDGRAAPTPAQVRVTGVACTETHERASILDVLKPKRVGQE